MRAAFLAGFIGGGLVAGFLIYQKGRELSGRGKALAQNLAEGGADLESYLLTQGSDLAADLERLALEESTRVARVSADQYMSDVYGLTPERMARIGVLGTALEGMF